MWSGDFEFTINTTIFNRIPFHKQVNEILGDFTSTILLAVDWTKTTFRERAKTLQSQLLEDLDHYHFNGVNVLREMARLKGQRTVLMPIVFTSTIYEDSSSFESLGKYVFGISQTPQVWLDCQIYESEGNLIVHWDSLVDLFPKGMIEDMFEAYGNLLTRLADEDAWTIPSREYLLPKWHQSILSSVNDTTVPLQGKTHIRIHN